MGNTRPPNSRVSFKNPDMAWENLRYTNPLTAVFPTPDVVRRAACARHQAVWKGRLRTRLPVAL